MDRELVVELARAAGAHDNGSEFRFVELRYLERFATLVAAAEREACAKLCEDYSDKSDIDHESHGYACAAAIRSKE